ncbi:MAG: short-chain dehydrogenase, partial [Flavobacteriales bacterium]|nr:short-chain dehydrogenase [Flavobacteriales bacterium]
MTWLNKTVWITGASSGIGRAAANQWAELGANVILSSRKEAALQEVSNQWSESQQSQSLILPLDLSQSDQLAGKVAEALQWAGTIDVMVHCGGISQRSTVLETDLSVDRRVMEVDYFGTLALTKALLPHFVERKSGQFVVVTSLMGLFS